MTVTSEYERSERFVKMTGAAQRHSLVDASGDKRKVQAQVQRDAWREQEEDTHPKNYALQKKGKKQ